MMVHKGSSNILTTPPCKTFLPQHSNQQLIPIYTEWTNHHLAKANYKPISDLTGDLCNPKRLVELVHAVTSDSLKDVPENLLCVLNSNDPVESIEKCLKYLTSLGINVSSIKTKDIRKGHLGAILSLLFALSYFKQQQKAALQLNTPNIPSNSASTQLQQPKTISSSNQVYVEASKYKKAFKIQCGASKKTESDHTKTQNYSSGYSSLNCKVVEQSQEDDLINSAKSAVTYCPDLYNQCSKNSKREEPTSKKSLAGRLNTVAFRMPPNSSSTIVSNNSHNNVDARYPMEESRTSITCVVGSSPCLSSSIAISQSSIAAKSVVPGLIPKPSKLAALSSFAAKREEAEKELTVIPTTSSIVTLQVVGKDQATLSLRTRKPLPLSNAVLPSLRPLAIHPPTRQFSKLPATLHSINTPVPVNKTKVAGYTNVSEKLACDLKISKSENNSSNSQLNIPRVPNKASLKTPVVRQLAQPSHLKLVGGTSSNLVKSSFLRPPSATGLSQTSALKTITSIESSSDQISTKCNAESPENHSNESVVKQGSSIIDSSASTAGITESSEQSVKPNAEMSKIKLFDGKEKTQKEEGAKKIITGLQLPTRSSAKYRHIAAVREPYDKTKEKQFGKTKNELKASVEEAIKTVIQTPNECNDGVTTLQKKKAICSPQLVRKTRLMQPNIICTTTTINSTDKQKIVGKNLHSSISTSCLLTPSTKKLCSGISIQCSTSSPSSSSSHAACTSSISAISNPPPSIEQSSLSSSVEAECEDKVRLQKEELTMQMQKPITRISTPQISLSKAQEDEVQASQPQYDIGPVCNSATSSASRNREDVQIGEISPQQEKRPVLAVKGISMQIQKRTEQQDKLRPEQSLNSGRQKLNSPLPSSQKSIQVDTEQVEVKYNIGIVSPMLQKPVNQGFVEQDTTTSKAEDTAKVPITAVYDGTEKQKCVDPILLKRQNLPPNVPLRKTPDKIEKACLIKTSKDLNTKSENGTKSTMISKTIDILEMQKEEGEDCASPVPPPPLLSLALHRISNVEDAAPHKSISVEKIERMQEVAFSPNTAYGKTKVYEKALSYVSKRKHHENNNDSYDDSSSSISSGVSETFDISTDDLTGSSSDYLPAKPSPSHMAGAVFGEVNKPISHQINACVAAYRLDNEPLQSTLHHRLSSNGQQISVDELLQRCKTSQRGVAFYSEQGKQPLSSLTTDSVQQCCSERVKGETFNSSFPYQNYHTIHVSTNNCPGRQAPPRILSPPPPRRLGNFLGERDTKEIMNVNTTKTTIGRSTYRRQQFPQKYPAKQRHMGSRIDNRNGEELYHSPTIAYHSHSLDRHSHLKIFSLASTASNSTNEGILLSAPSSPYRHLPVHKTIEHQVDKHNMLLSPGYAEKQASLDRHSVSAANKQHQRRAESRSDYQEQPYPNDNTMSRSMVLLQETQQQNGNSIQIQSPPGSLRRTSPYLTRRAPLSVAPQTMNSPVLPALPLRSANNNGFKKHNNGSMFSGRSSNEPSLQQQLHHSAFSSIYNYLNYGGLHLHKLSSAQPTNDLISVSTHSSPPTVSHLKTSLPNGGMDNNIYLNLKPLNPHETAANPLMEEKYIMEMKKLLYEMDAYRSTILQLSAKHEDYNHLIHIFDGKLGLMVRHVEKLQQKSHFKQEEIDKLRQEIEHLRLMSCNAGFNLPITQDCKDISHFDGAGEQLLPRRPSSPSESVVSHRSAMSTTSNVKKNHMLAFPLLNNSNGSATKSTGTEKETDIVSGRTTKKSWIRSSFNKAFNKAAGNGSSNSKSKSKLNPPTNGSVSDIEYSPIHTARSGGNRGMASAASTTRLENLDPNTLIPLVEMVELKKQLEDKDLALTDVRLDALDKAREVDILRETVHRLKNENKILKHNFTVLERRIRDVDDSRTSSHQSLSTYCQDESEQQVYDMPGGSCTGSGTVSIKGSTNGLAATLSVAESRCHSSSSKRSSGGVSISIRITLCVDLSGRLDFGQSSANLSSSSSIANSSQLTSASPHVGDSSSTISSMASFTSSNTSNVNTSKRELTIGYLSVSSVQHLTWEDIDQQLGLMLEEYLHRIDPDMTLGIDSYSSIIGYQLIGGRGVPEEVMLRVRPVNNEATTPSQTPAEILSNSAVIKIRLQGAVQNSMDALVLESLFPKSTLEQLLHSLLHSRRLVIYGATGIGKSNLARYIAKYLAENLNIEARNIVDLRFPDDDKDLRLQKQVQQQLIGTLKMEKKEQHILLLDNIQRKRIDLMTTAFVTYDQRNADDQKNFGAEPEETDVSKKPFVIVTLNRTSKTPVQNLQLHHGFNLFLLNSKMDAVKGYMGRYLRRRIAEQELSGGSHHLRSLASNSEQQLQCVIEFLNKVLNVVNDFIEKANAFDVTLGPRIFLQCPLNMEDSRMWFIELWNDKIVPYITKVARDSMNFLGSCGILRDPTLYVCEHWPWFDGDSGTGVLRHILTKLDTCYDSSDSNRQSAMKQHRRKGSISGNTAVFPAAASADFDPIYALERIEENRKI